MSDERRAFDGGPGLEHEAADEPSAGAVTDVPALGDVLVTGGGGFIGSHVVRELAAADGNDVRVLDSFEHANGPGGLPEDVTTFEGDVRDRSTLAEAVDGADTIVHLAGQVSVERSFERPLASHETNVEATIALLEHARREDARVVFASSAAIYGEPESVPVEETDPKRPESPYGIEKLAADQYVRVYGEQYDLPVVVLRYFNVYGPGATGGVVDTFVRRAIAGDPLILHGDGGQTRDFVHVRDVVRATVEATRTSATGRAYNVGTGERVSIQSLAETVREAVEVDVEVTHGPPRPGDVRHSGAAIDRAQSELGYEPQVGLEEGIESVVDAVATSTR